MLIGSAVSSGLAVLASFCLIVIGMSSVMQLTLDRYWQGVTLIGCLIAGGVGAVVSVMSQMTFGGLTLDYEAGRRILTMLGGFRPVIGMALGAVMWALTGSGVLAIGPADPVRLRFFRVLTAFLAGFSERWAQDMLGYTANQIAGPRRHPESKRDDREHTPPKRQPRMNGGPQ